MNRSSKSVLPLASSLFICSRSIGRCRITLPDRKSQVLFGPTEFSQTLVHPRCEHAPAALRTCSQWFLPREIHGLRCAVLLPVRSEIEFCLEIVAQFKRGMKPFAFPAAKAAQRLGLFVA